MKELYINIVKEFDNGKIIKVQVYRDFPTYYIQQIVNLLNNSEDFFTDLKKAFGEDSCKYDKEQDCYYVRYMGYSFDLDNTIFMKYAVSDINQATFINDFITKTNEENPDAINKHWINVVLGETDIIKSIVKDIEPSFDTNISEVTVYATKSIDNNTFKFIGTEDMHGNVLNIIRYEGNTLIIPNEDDIIIKEETTNDN